jgi:hypothetical protein
MSMAARATSSDSVKQCMTPATPPSATPAPSSRMMRIVSSLAALV